MTSAISLLEKIIGRKTTVRARHDPVGGRIASTPLSLTDRARNHFIVRLKRRASRTVAVGKVMAQRAVRAFPQQSS